MKLLTILTNNLRYLSIINHRIRCAYTSDFIIILLLMVKGFDKRPQGNVKKEPKPKIEHENKVKLEHSSIPAKEAPRKASN